MKYFIPLLILFTFPVFAENANYESSGHVQSVSNTKNTKTVNISTLDAVKIAGNLVENGDYTQATRILTMMPETNNLSVEIERWYLIAQMAQKRGDYDTAIKIYRKILDDQPDLAKIRYELALCYMAKKQWYRADYHLRLAMAGSDIPPEIKQQMMYYRWIARQNKNWNVWFNFGAAPDNNINQASSEQVCGNVVCAGNFCIVPNGQVCLNQKPEQAIGYNFILGGNYELHISEHWRWKNEGNLYTNLYNKHKYDDLYLSGATGPRYIWSHGDVWLAGIATRRWYGWDRYNHSIGGKIDTNYDWTRKLSTGLSLRITDNKFDDYDNYGYALNGNTYASNARISYSLDANKYIILRGGVDRETAKINAYENWIYSGSIGFGAELPYGFSVYLEPYFYWTYYDNPRAFRVVENNVVFQKLITEHNFVQRYAVSVSNNKFDVWGFVPTITFSYTKRDSNVKYREYDKTTIEFTMQQKF